MRSETERTVRIWRAEEMFRPAPLPKPDIRENLVDVRDGEPLPWETSGRAWQHQVFGGLFARSRVRTALAGESALFTCAVGESGELISGPAISECAWAVGQAMLGDQAAGGGDPTVWLSGSSRDGYLSVSRDNLPELPDGPLTSTALTKFAAELSELLGVTALLEPRGLRVRSFPAASSAATGSAAAGYVALRPLGGHFAADLARIAEALRAPAVGPALSAFLTSPPANAGRVDVRRNPLITRNGCSPDRIPPARWPADDPLVLSEQFAVNEILASGTALSAVHTPPGSDVPAVFRDLVAAIVVSRAQALAGLPSPDAAFGTTPAIWEAHAVLPPVPALAGFEIILADCDGGDPGQYRQEFGTVGDQWAGRAAETDYFASTARLAGGPDSRGMLSARLDGFESRRSFTDGFWRGAARGADALFRSGEPMRSVLDNPPPVDWPAAVSRFRSALAQVQSLSAERHEPSAALARFSALEEACDDAYSTLEEAKARIADHSAREPAAQSAVEAAEDRRRAALADLEAHQGDKPGLVVAVSTGLRAGRDWYTAHGTLRGAFDAAVRSRDEALEALQALRAALAQARQSVVSSQEAVSRFTGEMESLHTRIAGARRRWGRNVPEGPAYAETEDAALIELRENSAPWADKEFAGARAELLFAALDLHKTLILANAGTFRANLDAWADMVSGSGDGARGSGGRVPPEVALAAWQTFFLVVPVVSTTFESLGSLVPELGRGSVGWFLASGCERVPPRHVAGALWRANRAVLAGAGTSGEARAGAATAQSFAARMSRFGTWLPDGTWSGLPLFPRNEASRAAAAADDSETLRAVLSDLRRRA